jgi:adenine phosphoribosyltransferase
MNLGDRVRSLVRDVPDFPKPGIVFKDITPVTRDASVLGEICRWIADIARERNTTTIAGIESRGFLFAAGAAVLCGSGVTLIRKAGKLPAKTVAEKYTLEYGEATMEMHEDALSKEDRVLVVDDLLATGGTAEAACRLVDRLGAEVAGCLFVIELTFLGGRAKLADRDVLSLAGY